jgi:hypothetical protein
VEVEQMVQFISSLDVTPRFIEHDGASYRMTDYFGKQGSIAPGPQSFFVESLTPHGVAATHYHDTDQFQIFTAGEGRVGSSDVRPVLVHYADAFTPYGPLRSGEIGLRYMTIRAHADSGPKYIADPQARARKAGRGGRHVSLISERDLGDAPSTIELLPREADGLCVRDVLLGPSQQLPPLPVHGAAEYVLLVAGSVVGPDGREHPPLTSAFVRPGEAHPPLVAADDGARLMLLSFPSPRAA